MKFSACMIAKNEEKNIARCIESYKDIVTEIIVVDTGSTDKTVEIARSMGAKVFHYTWNNNFSEAKNYAIDRAKGDWIIFLDADEYFARQTAKNVPAIIKNLDKSFDTIACKMINIDYANGKMLDEVTHVRIFRRNKHIRYVNPIHEMLLNQEKNKNLKAFLADEKDLVIYHTGYSLSNRREKAERNLQLLLLELDKAAEKPAIYQYISDCYFGIEDWEQSINYARLFIESGAKFVGYNVKPHQNIIDSMLHLKYGVEDILHEINIGIKKFPKNPSFHFYLANMLYDLKKYDAAYVEYKKTLKLQETYDDIEINSIPPNIYYIYLYMGIIAEYRNDYEDALNCYINSLKKENKNDVCFNRLVALIKDLPAKDIIFLLNSLYNTSSEVDIEFIVNNLVNYRLPTVLAYYTNLRLKKFHNEDIILVYMLLANGQYDKTFNIVSKCFNQKPDDKTFELLTVISAVLSEDSAHIAWVEDYVSETFKKIIRGLFTNCSVIFTDNDKDDYYEFVKRMLLLGDSYYLNKTLVLSNAFDNDKINVDIGDILSLQLKYSMAIHYYNKYLESKELSQQNKAILVFKIAYCYYKLKDYKQSLNFFLQAYKLGYKEADVFQFLRWILNNKPGYENQIKKIIGEEIRQVYNDDFKLTVEGQL